MKNSENQIICDICGCIIEDDQEEWNEIDGDVYCHDCFEKAKEDGDISICACCGEYHSNEFGFWIDNISEWVCEDCFADDDNFYYCDGYCMYYYDTCNGSRFTCRRNWQYERIDISGETYSRGWLEGHDYHSCYECGEWHHIDYMREYDGDYYCDRCYDNIESDAVVHDYGYKPKPKFKCSPHDEFWTDVEIKDLLFGVELEVDDGKYDPETLAEEIVSVSDDVYCKHDGSLDEGVEIVTHPATLDYHLNTLAWNDISATCKANGFKSHNTSTCGLHVHVGRRQLTDSWTLDSKEITAKLILMLSRFRNPITAFTRRRNGTLSRWAEMPYELPDTFRNEDDAIYWAINNSFSSMHSRYHALNLRNESTVEFRIFRGTLNVNTIKATLQFVSNLCLYAKANTVTDCLSSQFEDIIDYVHYDELSDYVETRGIELDDYIAPYKYKSERALADEAAMKNAIGWAKLAAEDTREGIELTIESDRRPTQYDIVRIPWGGGFNRCSAFGVVAGYNPQVCDYVVRVIDAVGDDAAVRSIMDLRHDANIYDTCEYLWLGKDSMEIVGIPF